MEPSAAGSAGVGTATPEGDLAERDFARLLEDLLAASATGVLTLTRGAFSKSVTLRRGRIIFARSTAPDDRLPDLLLRQGRLTLDQYRELRDIDSAERVVPALVQDGVLRPDELPALLKDQVQGIVRSLFRWPGGPHRFEAGKLPKDHLALPLDTAELVLDGTRGVEEWGRVERGVGGLDARYTRAASYEERLGEVSLSYEQLTLLTALNGIVDLPALCRSSSLGAFEACRTIWALRVLGLVREVPRRTADLEQDEGLGELVGATEAAPAAAPEVPRPAPVPAPAPVAPPAPSPEPPAPVAIPPAPAAVLDGREPAPCRQILAVGVEKEFVESIQPLLGRSSFSVERVPSARAGLLLTERVGFALVVVRHPLRDMAVAEFLRGLRRPGGSSAAAPVLALAQAEQLGDLQALVSEGLLNAAVDFAFPQRLLDEVAGRLLKVPPRLARRLLVRFQVRMEDGRGLLMCQTENISTRGLLVRTDRPFPVGTRLSFDFTPPGSRSAVQGEAEVVRHTAPDVEKVVGVGVRFVSFKADGAKVLADYLASVPG